MPRIRVKAVAGLFHRYSGFWAQGPGDYDFPDDPRFAGFLQGHCERGTCEILAPEPVALADLPFADLKKVAAERGKPWKVGMSQAALLAALEEE